MQQLDAVLTKKSADFIDTLTKLADGARDQFITQVTAVSDDALGRLDDTLRNEIRDADRLLENRLGTLDALLSQQTTAFTYSFRRVAIFILILGAIFYLGFRVYKHVIDQKLPLKTIIPKVAWGAAATFVFAGCAYAITAANEKIANHQLVALYESHYYSAISSLNLDYAVYYSSQLHFLDRTNKLYEADAQKAALLRDVFARPSLYKTADGTQELLSRTAAALSSYLSIEQPLDPDLVMLYGYTIWQRGGDRFSEYMAANILASAIDDINERKDKRFFTLLPFAYYYIQAYTSNPIPDDVINSLFTKNQAHQLPPSIKLMKGAAVVDQPFPKRLYKINELHQLSKDVNTNIDSLAIQYPLYGYVRVNLELLKTYSAVIPRYAELIRLLGLESAIPAEQKEPLRAKIRIVGSEIVMNWDAYESFLYQNNFADNSAKLNNFKGLWAIYTRASGASSLPEKADSWTPLDEKLGIQAKWLDDIVRPSVRASTFRLIQTTTHTDFATVNTKLSSIEDLMKQFYQARQKLNAARSAGDVAGQNALGPPLATLARQIASSASDLGIFGCPYKEPSGFICTDQNGAPVPFAQLIFDDASGVSPKLVDADEIIAKIVSQRTVPGS
jgi:hypothetical protein